jgi:hypothetical protein
MIAMRSLVAANVLACVAVVLAPCCKAQSFDRQTSVLVNPLQAQPLETLSATRERPLFSPTRRSTPPAQVVDQAPANNEPVAVPSLKLFGIVRDGDGPRALVARSSKTLERLRIGDEIDGWSVTEINRLNLVLSRGDRSENVVLFSNQSKSSSEPTRSFEANDSSAPRKDQDQTTKVVTSPLSPTESRKRRKQRSEAIPRP